MTDTDFAESKQLTLWDFDTLEDAFAALAAAAAVIEWPVTPDHGDASQKYAARAALKAWKASGRIRSIAFRTLENWNRNCWPKWSEEDLNRFLDCAEKERVTWRERRALEDARYDRAAKVKRVAERLGVGERQAQKLIAKGTTDPETAKAIAGVFGEDLSFYLRQRGRRGRPANLRARFTAWRFGGGGFPDFQCEHPAACVFGYVESYDGLKANARSRGISDAVAEAVWRDFLRWRFDVLRRAVLGSEDGFDFG